MLAQKNRAKSMLGNDNASRGRAAAEPAADERAEAAVEQRDDDGLGHLRICRWLCAVVVEMVTPNPPLHLSAPLRAMAARFCPAAAVRPTFT